MPFVPGIKRLSQLVIDAAKSWAGIRIDNVGAPDTDDDVPRARATDILSGRFGMNRMPDGAPGLVFTGQGAGADPAYAAAAGAKINSGSYTGDGVSGRAIAHGLGQIPKIVLLTWNTGGAGLIRHFMDGATPRFFMAGGGGNTNETGPTAMDSTNFYLGSTAATGNWSGAIHYWIAIG